MVECTYRGIVMDLSRYRLSKSMFLLFLALAVTPIIAVPIAILNADELLLPVSTFPGNNLVLDERAFFGPVQIGGTSNR